MPFSEVAEEEVEEEEGLGQESGTKEGTIQAEINYKMPTRIRVTKTGEMREVVIQIWEVNNKMSTRIRVTKTGEMREVGIQIWEVMVVNPRTAQGTKKIKHFAMHIIWNNLVSKNV